MKYWARYGNEQALYVASSAPGPRRLEPLLPQVLASVDLDKRRVFGNLLAQDVLLEVPRELLQVIVEVLAVTNGKHRVELFESEVLCLGKKEVGVDGTESTPCGVPTKGTGGGEGDFEGGPGERDDDY